MDEATDVLKDILDRIDCTLANSAAGRSSIAETSASQRSAEQSQQSSFNSSKSRDGFQVINGDPRMCSLLCQSLGYSCTLKAYAVYLGGIF